MLFFQFPSSFGTLQILMKMKKLPNCGKSKAQIITSTFNLENFNTMMKKLSVEVSWLCLKLETHTLSSLHEIRHQNSFQSRLHLFNWMGPPLLLGMSYLID